MSSPERVVSRQERVDAYEQVVHLARHNGLILQGAGGALLVVHPDTQDKEGLTAQCLLMASITEADAGETDPARHD